MTCGFCLAEDVYPTGQMINIILLYSSLYKAQPPRVSRDAGSRGPRAQVTAHARARIGTNADTHCSTVPSPPQLEGYHPQVVGLLASWGSILLRRLSKCGSKAEMR
jgi:hypothetical protein